MNTADKPTCPIDGEPPLREIVAELASGAHIHIDDSNCYELRRHGKPIGSHTLNMFLVRNGWVQSTPNGGSYVLTDAGRLAYLRSTDELGNGELVAPSSHRDARHAAADLVASHPAKMMDTEVQKSKTAHPVVGLPCKDLPPALPARSAKDYTIEHAEYMAKGAEHLLDAIEALSAAELHREETDDDEAGDAVHDARDTVWEHVGGLRSDIYEFRKRKDRAACEAVSGSAKTALSVENRWLGDMMILQVLADSANVNEQEREVLARWLASSPLPPGESAEAVPSNEKAPESRSATAMEVLTPETKTRPCGHPLGTTRWCPECELAEARRTREFR